MRIIFLFFSFITLDFSSRIYSQSLDFNNIEFTSGYAMYDNFSSFIELTTNVVINGLDDDNSVKMKVKTDKASIDLNSSNIVMDSSFTIETSSMLLKAQTGSYNFNDKSGIFYNGTSYFDRFIVSGKEVDVKSEKYIYKRAFLTSCNEEPPHYHISSQRITFSPGKYFLSYNNLFYLGKIPILYFPVMYKPLGKGSPVMSQFYPGYDGKKGFYVKSNFTYKFSDYTKFKLFVDYFSKKGFGLGSEVYKYKSDSVIFDFSYYRIKEKDSNDLRWGFNGGIWDSLYKDGNSEIYLQSYVRMLSDPQFNNHYFRSNPFAVSDDKQWDLSLTYKLPYSYLRADEQVIYKSVNNSEKFTESYNQSPKIEYQLLTKPVGKLPLNHTLYLSAENTRLNNTYFQKKLNGNYTISNDFNIFKNLSFFNSAGYSGVMEFSTSSHMSDSFISRYTYNSNLRLSTLSNSYDIGYSGVFRSKVNKFSVDRNSVDDGIEESRLNLNIMLFSQIDKYFRFSNYYNLNKNDSKFADRFGPVTVEFYKKYLNYEIYFNDVYDINDGNKSFITQLNSEYEKNYLNIGFANYSSDKDKFIISNTLGYYPSKTMGWYGEFTLRYYVDISKDVGVNFFEKAFSINKEFHDFRAKFVARNRKDVNEFFLYITMKMNDPYRKNNIDREIDNFFKPWRGYDEERDY